MKSEGLSGPPQERTPGNRSTKPVMGALRSNLAGCTPVLTLCATLALRLLRGAPRPGPRPLPLTGAVEVPSAGTAPGAVEEGALLLWAAGLLAPGLLLSCGRVCGEGKVVRTPGRGPAPPLGTEDLPRSPWRSQPATLKVLTPS